MTTRLEEAIRRTTIDVPGKAHMETEDFKWMVKRIEQLEGSLKWIMPKVHQGNHEGEFEGCEKASCAEYRKICQ